MTDTPPSAPVRTLDVEVCDGLLAGTHVLDGELVRREAQHDLDVDLAWRLVTPCLPGQCHHPVHGLGRPHGCAHLTWLHPRERPLPLESEPLR